MKTYKSKIRIIPILLTFFIIGGLGHAIFNSEALLLQILYPALLLMALHIIFAKKYILGDQALIIKIAGFRTQKIPFYKIQKIQKLKSPVDSGLHLDRLLLIYNTNYDFDYIAPNKQESFIQELTAKNPSIIVSGFDSRKGVPKSTTE